MLTNNTQIFTDKPVCMKSFSNITEDFTLTDLLSIFSYNFMLKWWGNELICALYEEMYQSVIYYC